MSCWRVGKDRRIRGLLLLLVALGLGCTGGDRPQSGAGDSHGPEGQGVSGNRPPLRVVLVTEDGEESTEPWQQLLSTRWQAVAQQGVVLEAVTSEQISEAAKRSSDLWIFPSGLLGEVAELGVLSGSLERALRDEGRWSSDDPSVRWPRHWQRMGTYGGKLWGEPLGASFPVLMRGKVASEDRVDAAAQKLEAWPFGMQEAPSWDGQTNLAASVAVEPEFWRGPFSERIDRQAALDRFLIVLASLSPSGNQSSLLFDPLEMKPKFLTQSFVKAVMLWASQARRDPEAWLVSHGDAWQRVGMQKSRWAIGWPSDDENRLLSEDQPSKEAEEPPSDPPFDTRGAQKAEEAGLGGVELECRLAQRSAALVGEGLIADGLGGDARSPDWVAGAQAVLVDPGTQWLLGVGSNSRQSAQALRFALWLDEQEQREALARQSPWFSPRPSGLGGLAATDPAKSSYHQLFVRAWDHPSVVNELRFRGASQYRRVLSEGLVEIAMAPENAVQKLREMAEACEALTLSLDRSSQVDSLEKSLQ
ncbi:MAG: hypothetical protein ACKN81_18360 [Pirellulaceae bacterium]